MGLFTTEETRVLNDYSPTIGNRPNGIKLAEKLEAFYARTENIKSGKATIAISGTFVDVAVGLAYDGKPAVATLNFVGGTALYVKAAVWDGAGNLRITVNAAATAATLVSWQVDGR